jgi:hypothetical protein
MAVGQPMVDRTRFPDMLKPDKSTPGISQPERTPIKQGIAEQSVNDQRRKFNDLCG